MAGGTGRAHSLVTQGEVSWADGKITAVCEVPAGMSACARPDDAAGVQQCAQQLVQADPAGR
ncbi:hypothetical protein J116_005595 [Streptomyces thermolilacinus SPC6]|uniref:Uncharacterized protein n=1 Tax=Streptomyces thermolilacinus SPC6 TaxID=1306406 RepID=A0A1D3DNW7_9ACTN|nr:hypothetical protein J116_005595 [Streptomyces thermolilacinus SPC6]